MPHGGFGVKGGWKHGVLNTVGRRLAASFQHALPFERSSLTRWRQRLGEEQLSALIQESLSVAHRTGALATKDLERVAVDTTVQSKNMAFPTDARLLH